MKNINDIFIAARDSLKYKNKMEEYILEFEEYECDYCSKHNLCVKKMFKDISEDISNSDFKNTEYYNQVLKLYLIDSTEKEFDLCESGCFVAACFLGKKLKLTPTETYKYIVGYNSVYGEECAGIGFCLALSNTDHCKDVNELIKFLNKKSPVMETE